MTYFLKLNVVGILYALMVFVPLELMLNVYRLTRLTNWEIGTVNILTGLTFIIGIIGGTILIHFLSKRWLGMRKANFWTVILWLPYFVLFIYVFASLFPITNGGDAPNPVTGLLALGGLIIYPFYILILNVVGMTSMIIQLGWTNFEDSLSSLIEGWRNDVRNFFAYHNHRNYCVVWLIFTYRIN